MNKINPVDLNFNSLQINIDPLNDLKLGVDNLFGFVCKTSLGLKSKNNPFLDQQDRAIK